MNDLRYALRSLARSPGFTTVAVLTLALGIGANTAIFSVVNGVLLRPLPYPRPDALMQVETVFQSGAAGNVSYPDFQDLWTPRDRSTEDRTAQNWHVVGRLRDGISRDRAQQDLSAIARRLKQQHGEGTYMTNAAVRPVLEQLVGSVRPALVILLGAAAVLLLVACVNVVNLMLARALSRDRDLALRLALGARPVRLAGRFLVESLVLSLAGAGLGVLLAVAGVPLLLAFEPGRLPRAGEVGVDWRVLAFALAVSLLAAVAVGLVPAIRAARRDAREALTDTHRSQGGGVASQPVRGALVASQVALTIVLLVGAGLLGRTFLKLLAVDPGYRTRGALVMDVWLPYGQDTAVHARVAGLLA